MAHGNFKSTLTSCGLTHTCHTFQGYFIGISKRQTSVFLSLIVLYKRKFDGSLLFTALKVIILRRKKTLFSLSYCSPSSLTNSMAISSETPYATGQTASSCLLGIKAKKNLILNFDPSKYDRFFQPLIECLCHSLQAPNLTMCEVVPLIHNVKKTKCIMSHNSI